MTDTLDIKIRLAQNEEGPVVQELVAQVFSMVGYMPEFDNIFPNWLVAEIAGEIVATINIRLSNPFSSVEMLAFKPDLDRKIHIVSGKLLIDSARALCAANGSSMISSMIPDDMPGYLRVSQKKGYVTGNHGTIVFGRIR